MQGMVGDMAIVVVAVLAGLVATLLIRRTARNIPAAWRDWTVHAVTGVFSIIAAALILIAALVAVAGQDMTNWDGYPAVRIVFVLAGAVGLAIVLFINKRTPFWPNWVIIGTYALTLSAIVLLISSFVLPINIELPPLYN